MAPSSEPSSLRNLAKVRAAAQCVSYVLDCYVVGVQESVELLAGVACLDPDQVSPICLEIGVCSVIIISMSLAS